MSPKQLEKYKQSLKWEYTEETKKAIAEGKRLYVKSGSYPADDDPKQFLMLSIMNIKVKLLLG